jgi:septum formation protein
MCASNPRQKRVLILASGSPRRRELLALLGLPFVVRPADVQEENHVGESVADMVLRLSQDKARATLVQEPGLILAADTSVCLEGDVLGKPTDRADAVRMLRALRGRSHTVFSGVTLLDGQSGRMCTQLAQTTVWMRDYGDAAIAAYVATGDPLDKAGSYAIQYGDFAPVGQIDGCYANVMGLPLCHVYCLLQDVGQSPPQTPVAACDQFNRRRCNVALAILAAKPSQRALPRSLFEQGY